MTAEEEFIEFVSSHDLDETEYFLLEEWANSGHSVYSNPDRFCYENGDEVPYMKWYWILNDDFHPAHYLLIRHRRKL